MKAVAAAQIFVVSLLMISHCGRAQKPSNDPIHTSLVMLFSVTPQSLVSFLLLGLTVVLSGCVYIWVLRYVCVGFCQPIPVGNESEALAEIV